MSESDAAADGGNNRLCPNLDKGPTVAESGPELYEAAAANGWAHDYDRTPYDNLRALFEATEHVDADRGTYTAVAYRRIMGLGPSYISRTYAALARKTDLDIPGEGGDGGGDTERGADEQDVSADQSATEADEGAAGPGATRSQDPADNTAQAADTTDEQITAHYRRVEDHGVYAALGGIDADVAGGDADLSALGNQDFVGWYRSRDDADGWDGRGRPWALAREFGDLRAGLDRVVYATTNYAPVPWFMEAWDRFDWADGGRTWETGSSPTPGYDTVHAYAPFADIDLADEIKHQRPAGEVPTDRIEDALRRYVDAFADLAGGREHVFALDSVGGAYLFVAPTATAPIAAEFAGEDRAVLFEELTDRLNDWLVTVADRVTEAAGVAGVFEPDAVNHKNRLYKAPLSVHSSLDGVVAPIDVDAPSYAFTPLAAVGDDLVAETRAWADAFTADHREAVGSIVATLWPEHYDAAGDWRAALAAWLEDHREDGADAHGRDRDRREIPADEIPDDLETTDDLDVVTSAVEAVPVDDLIRRTVGAAVEGVDTDHSSDGIRFDPPWRHSESGESCFADSEKFYDPDGAYAGGGPLAFIAAERGIIRRPGDELTGSDYWRAVNALREEGYAIPYFEGADGRHRDVLRVFTEPETDEDRKRQLARSLFADR